MTTPETSTPPFKITDEAAAEILKLAKVKKLPAGAGVKVGVQAGGCSGFTYLLDFVDAPPKEAEVLEEKGVRVFVAKKSLPYISGCSLDFTGGLQGKGFQFHNPQATSTCRCGESFSV